MFAGMDIASERHMLARLDAGGAPIGRPMAITEDREGHQAALAALGPPPALIVMEATGHYWKNLYATLVAAGHEVALINPLAARRFQQAELERTKTDAIDAAGLARLAFEKRPTPSRLHDEATEALRELVRHRDRLRQDFDDRVRQLHRLVDLGFPEFTRLMSAGWTASLPPAFWPKISRRRSSPGRTPSGSPSCATTAATWSARRSPGSSSRRPAARSASTTGRSTRCRRATSARTSTSGGAV